MNIFQSLASAEISDITRPRASGRMVDTRVVTAKREPRPDYDQMRRVIHGDHLPSGQRIETTHGDHDGKDDR